MPGAGDTVVISAASGNPTITISASAGNVDIQSLDSARPLTLAAGATLQADSLQISQNLTLSGGVLKGATVTVSQGAKIVATSAGGTLDGVTLAGDATLPSALEVSGYNASVQIKNDLTLNSATVGIGAYGRLDFLSATANLTGSGKINFETDSSGNSLRETVSGGTLTIGSGITVAGLGGSLGYSSYWGGPSDVTLVNQGTIGPDQVGTFYLSGANVLNKGTLEVSAGATLTLQTTTWTNTGVISAPAGILNLGGSIAVAQLGSIQSAGATVYLNGTIDVTGSTLALNQTTGSWLLHGGTLKGGTLTVADGAQLLASNYGGLLDGIVLKGDASLPTVLELSGYNAYVQVKGDLTLDSATVGLNSYARVDFLAAAASIAGAGRIKFETNSSGNSLREVTSGGTLTIGSGIAVVGYGGSLGYSNYWGGPSDVTLINQGTIGPDQVGTFYLGGANVLNEGTLQLVAGATLNLQTTTWTNTGVISAPAGTLNLGGSVTVAQLGSIHSAGATVYLNGTIDATGSSLALNQTTGSWLLHGGTLKGGTLTVADGAQLLATNYGGLLDGIVLKGDATLPTVLEISGYNAYVQVKDDLTLDSATVGLNSYARVDFLAAVASIAGAGRINFETDSSGNSLREVTSGGTLTINSGISVEGFGGSVGYSGYWGGPSDVTLVNKGTIGGTAAGTFYLGGANVLNESTLKVGAGATLNLQSTTWTNTGVISAPAGTLNLGGTVTVAQLGSIQSAGATVYLNGTIDATGSTFALNQTTGSWLLHGGTLKGGTLTIADGAQLLATNYGGLLDGMVLKGNSSLPTVLEIAGYNTYVQVNGDLTLDSATVGLNNYGRVDFLAAAASIAGAGRINFETDSSGNSLREVTSGGTLTVDAGITVAGLGGSVGYSGYWGGPSDVTLINKGTIGGTAAGTFYLGGANVLNESTLKVGAGGTLNLQATTWTNTGVISAPAGTLNLGGSVTVAQLGSIQSAGATVNVIGTIDATGSSLALNQTTGSWFLRGGTLKGGKLTIANGAQLLATNYGGLLDGITLKGDSSLPTVLELSSYNTYVQVKGDLTLDSATVGLNNYARVDFLNAAASISGAGRINFETNSSGNSLREMASGGTLTIGSGVSVAGFGGSVGYSNYWGGPTDVTLVNKGTIGPDHAGTVYVAGASVTNLGTFQALGGGVLDARSATLTNLTNAALTGGVWSIGANSTIKVNAPSQISLLQASVILDGSGASLTAYITDSSGVHALPLLAPLSSIGANGHLTLTGGAQFTTVGDLANAGTVTVGTSSQLALTGAFNQNGGTLDLQGGTIGAKRPPTDTAAELDGVNDIISVAASPSLNTSSDVTVSGWYKADGFPRYWQVLFYKGQTTGTTSLSQYSLWLRSDGALYFGSTPTNPANSSELSITSAAGLIQSGHWYQISAVINSNDNSMKLYVDGQVVAQGAYDASGIRSSTAPLLFGQTPNYDSAFHGSIADVAVYQTAKDQSAIQAGMYRVPSATDSGLAAAWRFDGSSNVIKDVSSQGNDAYLGSVAERFPQRTTDQALGFDGVDDTVEIPDAPALRPATALTVEAWINPTDTLSGTRSIVAKPVGNSYLNSYAIWYEGGQLRGGAANAASSSNYVAYTWNPTPGTWHHVAYTINSSGQNLYLDGQLVASNTSTTTLGYDSHPLVIGADYNNEVWGLPWNGKIKDVRLWSVARSAAQVQSDMSTAVNGTETGLSGAWRLDDGQGGVIADKTAHANSGVLGQNLNSRPAWTSDSALAFDGVNDFVDMGSPADNRLDLKFNSTIEADVRFTALPNGNLATIVGKDVGSGNQNKWIFAYASNYGGVASGLVMLVNNASANQYSLVASDAWTPTVGAWYHLAVVKTGSTYAFYVNGSAMGSAVSVANANSNSGSLVVGRAESQFGLNGAIRNLSLWSTALSPAELQSSSVAPPNGDESGLVGAWRFDEASGVVARDRTSAGNDGLLGLAKADRPNRVDVNQIAPVTTSLAFDGVNDVVHIGDIGARPPQGALSFWMNSTSVDNYRNVLTTGPLPTSGSAGNGAIRFEQSSNGALAVLIGSPDGTTFTSHLFTPSLSSGAWVHIALVWDSAAGRVQGYLNGELAFDDANTTWPDEFSDLNLGDGYTAVDSGPSRHFLGQLAEVQYWNIALDAAGVAATMTAKTGSEAGLAGYWPLSAGAGTVAADLTSGAHNGTLGTGDASTLPLWSTQHAVVVDNEGGLISGSGVISGDVVNAGVIAVGGAGTAGELSITGAYRQTSSGSLQLDIGGLDFGSAFDRLDIGGAAVLAGQLTATYINGFAPNVGDAFKVLTFASANSTFDVIGGSASNLVANYETDDLVLLNEVGDIIVSPTSGLVTTGDGGQASFTVVLGRAPTADVTIEVDTSDPSQGTVSTQELVFTAQNWNVPQTVTVTGLDDLIVDGDIAYSILLKPAVSNDPLFNGVDPSDVSLVNKEVDHAGIAVSPATLTTAEGGASKTFSVALTSKPTANVTIKLRSSNTKQGVIDVSSLTFTPQNWNVLQVVTVSPIDDGIVDGDVAYTIIFDPATSADPTYNGLTSSGVAVTNQNTDLLDLQIGNFSISPSSGLQSGDPVVLHWAITNVGTVATAASFSDQLVVRNKTTGVVVGTISVPYDPSAQGAGSIAPGQTKTRQTTFTLPDGPDGAGDLEFSITIDATRDVAQSDYTNDTATLTVPSTLPDYPDLQVNNLRFDSAQPLVAGGQATLRWDDANSGAGTASSAWNDHVKITNTTTGEVLVDTTVAYDPAAQGASALNSGQSAPRSFAFTLPDGSRGIGSIQATVTVNSGGTLYEYAPGGSASANNTADITSTSSSAQYPNLTPNDLKVSAVGGALVSGATLSIGWNDRNIGGKATSGGWVDAVTIDNVTTGQTLGHLSIPYDGSASGDGPLSPAGTSARSAQFTLPDGANGSGDIRVTINVDSGNAIFEDDGAGHGESDNSLSATVTVASAPYPDLTVANASIDNAAALNSGDLMTVHWTDVNLGHAPANQAWYDTVVFLNTSTGKTLGTVTSLYDPAAPGAGALAAGATVARQASLQLPKGSPGAGAISVTITTDAYNQVFEQNDAGTGGASTAESNNSASVTTSVALAPYADLAVKNVTAPALTVADPAYVTIGWTTANVGTADATGPWVDTIIASPDSDPTHGVVLAQFTRTSNLAAGASYTRQETILLPPAYQTDSHLFVKNG